MLKRLWIVPGYASVGTWYSLTSNSNGYRIRNIDGIEPVKADINTTNNASMNGIHINSAYQRSRNIVVTIGLYPGNSKTLEDLRKQLYLNAPVGLSTRLSFDLDEGGKYRLIEAVVESNEMNRFSKDPEQVISFICPDPYFTSSVETTYPVHGSDLTTGYVVPYSGTAEAGFNFWFMLGSDIKAGGYFQVTNKAPYGRSNTQRLSFATDVKVNAGQNAIAFNSVPGDRRIIVHTSSWLKALANNHTWPMLRPGNNTLKLDTKTSSLAYNAQVTFTERYGEL